MNAETADTAHKESMIRSDGFLEKSKRTNSVRLQLKEELELPLEAEVLTPDVIGSLSRDEILKLPVILGTRRYQVSDFFEIEGEKSRCLELHGNLAMVKTIGRNMTGGSIVIHGNAGMHLGASMSGGLITVHGNASDWLGAEMSGGLIRIRGNAGGRVGAAYSGSLSGMRGGVILIDGTAGIEVAKRMRRGLICVQGAVGDFAGLQMRGGTLFLCGTAGIRAGAWMSRGTIIALAPLQLLPTFIYACTHESDFLHLLLRQLHNSGVADLGYGWNYQVKRYTGDTSRLGKGEILVCAPAGVQ
ncbi:MAG TPA: formylmethanofuran dehydrogenase subunit C [Acidobacteriota bacterium]|nr:formylmethanofuran dehydrogenase subunit C [Acidobacteriota bacterium]